MKTKEKLEELLKAAGYTFDFQPALERKSELRGKTIVYSATTSPIRDLAFLKDLCNKNKMIIIKDFITELEAALAEEE